MFIGSSSHTGHMKIAIYRKVQLYLKPIHDVTNITTCSKVVEE